MGTNKLTALTKNELLGINGGLVLGVDCVVAALVLTVPLVVGTTYLLEE